MLAKYDKFNKKRRPAIILCNPDGSQLYSLVGIKDTQITLRYNDVSEFSFKAYSHGNGRSNAYYKLLTSRRRVLIKDVGMFIITKVIEVGNEKTVQCKSLEHMATEIGFYLEEGTYKFYEAVSTDKKTIVDCILEKFVGWEIGGVDSSLWDLHRTFDVTDKSLYDFIKGDVEKAYNCIFIFDTINKTITIKDGNKSANKTNISLSSKNLIKEAEIEELSEDVITALNVYGAGDLTIRSVNPLGSTIYDFSYYKTSEWMDDDLINAITVWENKVKTSEASFKGNLNNIKVHNKELITLNTTLKELENRLSELETLKAVRLEQDLDISDINSQIEIKKSEITNQKELIKNKKTQIDTLTKANSGIVQDNSFNNNFTQSQYETLQAFIKIGKYQNTKFVISDSMTDVEKQEITEELFTVGKAELSRLVEPRYNCRINAINFTELIKYKKFTDELELGCQITVRLDNDMLIYPTLLEITFSYEDVTELELGFSNKLSMNKSANTIGDAIKDASNTSNDVVLNRDKWNQGLNAKNQLTEYMNNSLNASLQDIVNSDYQDIVIDGSGIRCRRFDPEKGEYDKEMLWITGKSLVFSDDQFQTAKTALGMITLPDGTKTYGLNAGVLVSKIVATSQLIIENEGGTFLVDGEGVTLINAKLIIRNQDGSETTVDKELDRVEDKIDQAILDSSESLGNAINGLEGKINAVKNEASTNLGNAVNKLSNDIKAVEDGVVEIFYDTTQPANAKHGDLWFDTSANGKNRVSRYNTSVVPPKWESVQDQDIVNALQQAQNAQSTADKKIKTFYQNNPPTQGMDEGDLWFDTNDNNRQYRYDEQNGRWVDVRDNSINEAVQSALDKKVTTYYDTTAPANPNLGDLWFDTSVVNGSIKNKLHRWDGTKWDAITDKQIIDAIEKAQNAQDTADKKIVTYYQATQPTEGHVGDLWIDTDDNNKMYRFDGASWLDISYKGINAETAKEIQGALDKIKDVQDIVDGKIEIYYATSQPSGAKQGDIWVDISLNDKGKPKNRMYRYDNNKWVIIQDDNIENIFAELGQLEIAVDGKVTTYYGTVDQLPPASELHNGDLWVDTSNHNKLMIRQGSAWIDVSIGGEDLNQDVLDALNKAQEALTKADQALAMADGMVDTYYQATQPSGAKIGDLWINSSTGRVNILTSSGWKESQDQSIKEAIDEANKALGIANGKTTTYYQDEMPKQGKIGDIWIDTDDSNKVYVHNGSTFVLTLGDLITDNDMLLSNIYDGFFDHDKKFWSESYSGQVVQSTEIGKIVDEGISGGKALEIQGEHTLYAKNAIPVETNRTFKFILKIKQKKHATTAWKLSKWKNMTLGEMKSKTLNYLAWYNTDEMMIGAGVVCLDAKYNIIGSPKYFVANDKLIRPTDGWLTLEGIITGIGAESNKFAEGVKYIRPFFRVNKPNGNGIVLVDSLVMKDITEGKQAQDNIDRVEDKLDNVLTIDGNINTSKLEGTLNSHVNAILAGANMQLVMDKDGIWAMNNPDKKLANRVVAMNENGIVMAKERVNGQLKWRTAISAEGINADEINTGTLRALNILGCNFEVSNERGKVLINPTDGIKIQKKSGSTWSDTLYIDTDGDAVFKGKLVGNSLNINGNFTVDRSGNCVAKSIKISGANSELDAKDMVVRNLVVGQNVFMGDNAKITWGNLPDDVAGMTDVPSDSKIKGLALNEVGAKLGITHTTIGKAFIESPSIRGGYIEGGEINQTSSNSDSWGNCKLIGGRLQLLDKAGSYLGAVMGDNGDKKMWVEGMNALKLQAYNGDISINPQSIHGNSANGKIYLYGHVVVVGGKITDENGKDLKGSAVFG